LFSLLVTTWIKSLHNNELPIGGNAVNVATKNNLAYVAADDKVLCIINIKDPFNTFIESCISTSGFASKVVV
jgi:hypothetical protein